jgi:hypothetical protein
MDIESSPFGVWLPYSAGVLRKTRQTMAVDRKYDHLLVKNGTMFLLSNWTLCSLTEHEFILLPGECMVLRLFAERESLPPSPSCLILG